MHAFKNIKYNAPNNLQMKAALRKFEVEISFIVWVSVILLKGS